MKHLFLGAAIAMACTTARACDMCGGATGNQYIGLLPAFNRSFAGVQYLSGSYSGAFPSSLANAGGEKDHTEDHNNTLQLWGRHRLGKRYQVFAFAPYQYNVRYTEDGRSVRSGLGDVSLLLNRLFIQTEHGDWNHTLFGGAGVKLPTGKSGSGSDGVMPSADPGTGTFDFSANGNYTVRRNKAGVNIDIACTITTEASDKYKYGNRVSAGLAVFYTMQIGKVIITPQTGLRYEYAMQDYYNYERNWLNSYSGGQVLSATAGMLLSYQRYGMRVNGLLPVYQCYAGGEIKVNYKTEAGLFILF